MVNRSRFGSTVDKGRQLLEKRWLRDWIVMRFCWNTVATTAIFDWAAVSADTDRAHEPKTPMPAFERGLGDMVDMLRAGTSSPY